MAAQAGIAAGASLISGILGGKGAKKAAAAQTAAYEKGIAEQRRQYDTSRADFMPYMEGGGAALGSSLDLLGLNGAEAQQAAIAQLKGSPGFTSLYDTGQDTILQNSAATGGLRGGNTQNSLANFGSGLLSTVIQNQLGQLGGIASLGAGATGQVGQLGANSANQISGLLGQQGNAKASGIAGQYGAWLSALGGITNAAGNYFGGASGGGSAGNIMGGANGVAGGLRGW